MKLFIQLIMLCGLIMTSAHAENTPATEAKATATVKPSDALDRDSACTRCHDETENKPILSIYQTAHGNKADSRTPSCQSCHGESEKHLSSKSVSPDIIFGSKKGVFAPSDVKDQNTACLTCHDKDQKRTNWQGGAHQVADVACTSCHVSHTAHDKVRDKQTQPEVCFTCHKDQRAQVRKFSHHPIAEGKVACADCHNPHGSAGPKSLVKNTVTETCYTCHAEKRGPFLWEHQPVTEDCSNCHTPHGSNITPLLKSRAPFLCQECHDGPHQSDAPAAGNAAGIQGGLSPTLPNGNFSASENFTGRACMNCHSMVHGSNHPAGALLHR
ncbi:MAG: DmsE family decaheme c-type cytochrome [Methylococcaceae bacterium]|nr:DmsE family decaheme c-type cytochrome [Methylococcaceae bacterium]